MKKLIAGVVLGVTMTATALAAGDPEAGEANAAVCASCHGEGGAEPIMSTYPKLAELGEKYLYRQLMLIQSGEREIASMAGILDGRSDQDLQDLAAYFNSQETTMGQASPELVDLGEKIYRGGNLSSGVPACAACHSPEGKGNEPAAYPHLAGQNPDYVVKQLEAYASGDRDAGNQSSVMMDIAGRLTDEEMEAVANYVFGLY